MIHEASSPLPPKLVPEAEISPNLHPESSGEKLESNPVMTQHQILFRLPSQNERQKQAGSSPMDGHILTTNQVMVTPSLNGKLPGEEGQEG